MSCKKFLRTYESQGKSYNVELMSLLLTFTIITNMLHVDDDRRFWGTACKTNVFIDRLYAAFMKIYFLGFQT